MKKSKFLAVFLAFVMLLTLVPATALAEETAGNEPGMEQTTPAEETEAPDGGEEVPGGSGAEAEPVELTEVQKLQARIDALPGGDELDGMDEDRLQAVSDGALEIMDALEELTEEEFAALDRSKLDALMAWFEVVPETAEGEVKATIGTTEYKTLAAAITAAKRKTTCTIVLQDDILLEGTESSLTKLIITQNVTIDFNGHTITQRILDADGKVLRDVSNNFAVFFVSGSAIGAYTLTLTGNGGIINESGYGVHLAKSSAKLFVEDGTYKTSTTFVNIQQGTATINGGTFEVTGTPTYLLNCVDDDYASGKAKIIVNSGTFKGFDPAHSQSESPEANFCGEGAVSVDNGDGTYTVMSLSEVAVAKDDEGYYMTLNEAIASAMGGDVTLLKDVNEDVIDSDDNCINLICGEHMFTGNLTTGDTVIINDGTAVINKISCVDLQAGFEDNSLTIPANVTVNGGTAANIYVEKDATLTLKDGTYTPEAIQVKGTSTLVIEGGIFNLDEAQITVDKTAKLTIKGGTFSQDVEDKYLAEGYASVPNSDGTYTVKPLSEENAVAKIGDTLYATLAAAINAADNSAVVLLKDTEENVTVPTGKTLTLDLNGCTLDGGTTKNSPALTNNGTITIKDSKSGGTIKRSDTLDSASYYTILNNGTMTIDGGKIENNSGKMPPEWEGASLICNGPTAAATLTINDGTISQDYFIAVKNDEYGTLSITGGTISSKTQAVQNWKDATISGGTLTGAVTTWTYLSTSSKTEITGGTITGEIQSARVTYRNQEAANKPAVTISGNAKIDAIYLVGKKDYATNVFEAGTQYADLIISGGVFKNAPDAAYIETGKAAVPNTGSDKAEYPFMIGDSAVNVETAVAAGEPEVTVAINDTNVTAENVKKAANDPKTQTNLANAATTSGLNNDENVVGTKEHAETELKEEVTVGADDKITVVIQPYLDVEVKSYEDFGTEKSMTVDIKALYDVVATTDPDDIHLKAEGGKVQNAVPLKTKQTMKVTTPVTITLPLPTDFVTSESDNVYVKHIKGSTTYVYKADVTKDSSGAFTATFVNPNGFSLFILTNETAASITDANGVIEYYDTLEAAVAAVEDGQTIQLLKDNDEKVTVKETISFNLNKNGKAFTGKITNGSYTSIKTTENDNGTTTYEFVYSKPSSGGSSSGSSSYSITVEKSKHGTVTSSDKSARKVDTVTITVKPDKGYELDELTVTDKYGDSVKLKKKSDSKYTFTMPAGKVEVEAVFTKIKEQVKPDFIDVPDGYWAEDAIDWAFEKGYMNGTSADTFNPGGDVSRQQLWMILARLSGADPANMAEARSWAVDNGISDGTFPGRAVSRQQLVTILYRYAARMGYKTSGTADLTRFPDHASVAAYARDAMSWSVANDIVGGTAAGTLDPTGTATRAQFAVILSRFCENIVD